MNSLILYDQVRDQMRTGDVVAFSGSGPVSEAIKFKTDSEYSHVGMVLRRDLGGGLGDTVLIAESDARPVEPDIEYKVITKGLVILVLSQKLDSYSGKAWWLQLKDPLTPEELFPMEEWIRERRARKTRYDYFQATAAGLKLLDALKVKVPQDFSSLFCSEFVGGAFQKAGRVNPDENVSDMLPSDIGWLPIFHPGVLILDSASPALTAGGGK